VNFLYHIGLSSWRGYFFIDIIFYYTKIIGMERKGIQYTTIQVPVHIRQLANEKKPDGVYLYKFIEDAIKFWVAHHSENGAVVKNG
jgi:hypothetical protein